MRCVKKYFEDLRKFFGNHGFWKASRWCEGLRSSRSSGLAGPQAGNDKVGQTFVDYARPKIVKAIRLLRSEGSCRVQEEESKCRVLVSVFPYQSCIEPKPVKVLLKRSRS